MDFKRMKGALESQTVEARVRAAPTLVEESPDPEPEAVGDPTPGAIGVLAFVALCVSLLLAVCRICGADIGIVSILAPLWGSALALSLAGAVVTTIAWAGRNG